MSLPREIVRYVPCQQTPRRCARSLCRHQKHDQPFSSKARPLTPPTADYWTTTRGDEHSRCRFLLLPRPNQTYQVCRSRPTVGCSSGAFRRKGPRKPLPHDQALYHQVQQRSLDVTCADCLLESSDDDDDDEEEEGAVGFHRRHSSYRATWGKVSERSPSSVCHHTHAV